VLLPAIDLDGAAWCVVAQRQYETVQIYHCGNEVQAEPSPGRVPALVGAVEAAEHSLTFLNWNTRPRIGDPNDRSTFRQRDLKVNLSLGGCEFRCIVHKVRHGFEQQVSITRHRGY
jgi:hypothetical protein